MQFENSQGPGTQNDDTATNGFKWKFCNYPNWSDQKQMEYEGNWGTWRTMKMCPINYYAAGFKARIEPPQGLFSDDTAMNGLQLRCKKPGTALQQDIMIFEGLWGSWRDWRIATPGKFLYSVKMRNQPPVGNSDDTAMNGLRFLAKNLP